MYEDDDGDGTSSMSTLSGIIPNSPGTNQAIIQALQGVGHDEVHGGDTSRNVMLTPTPLVTACEQLPACIGMTSGTVHKDSSPHGNLEHELSSDCKAGSIPTLKRNKRKNRSKAKRRATKHSEDLPVVDPELAPLLPKELFSQFYARDYQPTQDQLHARDEFFNKNPRLVSLKQTDDVTSLHLFGPDGKTYATPGRVMVDTGAELKMMISPDLARKLGLTWTPGSAKVIGMGGDTGGDGYTNEKLVARLGGFKGDLDVGPFQGCFSMTFRPLVVTQKVVDEIGYEVILGQDFLRACLGSVDYLTETLDYSPAWMTHACAEFRCSIPCRIASNRSTLKAIFARVFGRWSEPEKEDSLQDLVVASTRLKLTHAPHDSQPTSIPSRVDIEAASNESRIRAAPFQLHPGFPQAEVPSKQQHQDWKQRQAARRQHDKAVAEQLAVEARARASEKMTNIISPSYIGYPLKDLQASGRLLDGFKLDLSHSNVLGEAQVQMVADRVLDRLRNDAIVPKGTVVPLPTNVQVDSPVVSQEQTQHVPLQTQNIRPTVTSPPPSPTPSTPTQQPVVDAPAVVSPPRIRSRAARGVAVAQPGVSALWLRMKGEPLPQPREQSKHVRAASGKHEGCEKKVSFSPSVEGVVKTAVMAALASLAPIARAQPIHTDAIITHQVHTSSLIPGIIVIVAFVCMAVCIKSLKCISMVVGPRLARAARHVCTIGLTFTLFTFRM